MHVEGGGVPEVFGWRELLVGILDGAAGDEDVNGGGVVNNQAVVHDEHLGGRRLQIERLAPSGWATRSTLRS
jgi:hypothetical protein